MLTCFELQKNGAREWRFRKTEPSSQSVLTQQKALQVKGKKKVKAQRSDLASELPYIHKHTCLPQDNICVQTIDDHESG